MCNGCKECALLDSGPQDGHPYPGGSCGPFVLSTSKAGPWMGVQRGRPGPELREPRAPFPGGHAQEAVRGPPQPAVPFKLLTSSPGSLLMGLLRKVGPDYASCHQRSPVMGCNYAMNTALPVPEDSRERKTWGRVGWGPQVLTGPGSGPHHHGWATSPIMLRHNRAKVIKPGHPASQAIPAATHRDHACQVTGQVVRWRPGLPPWSVSWAGVRFSRLHQNQRLLRPPALPSRSPQEAVSHVLGATPTARMAQAGLGLSHARGLSGGAAVWLGPAGNGASGTDIAPFPLSQLLFRNQLVRVGPSAQACCQSSGQRWALSSLQPR